MLAPDFSSPDTTRDATESQPSPLELLPDALKRRLEDRLAKLTRRAEEGQLRDIAFAKSIVKAELKKIPEDVLDTSLAYMTGYLPPYPALTAAVIGTYHLGSPHMHAYRPGPLPSFGALEFGGCASVLIHGQRAARVGDLGFAITCLSVTPYYQITTGSANVFIGGARAARLADFTRHCGTAALNVKKLADKAFGAFIGVASKPAANTPIAAQQMIIDAAAAARKLIVGLDPGAPPCMGALLPLTGRVAIGGYPLPEAGAILGKLTGAATGLAKRLVPVIRNHALATRLGALLSGTYKKGRASNLLPAALRRFTGHPVDIVAGRFVLDATDVELPGALPIRLARNYSSTWGSRPSVLGHGWSHSLDEAVWREPGQLVYRTDDGRELELPNPDREQFVPLHRLTLRPLADGALQIQHPDGTLRDFNAAGQLLKIHDRRGHRIDLEYEHGRLVRVHAPDGRALHLHYHDDGHLARVDLPDPHDDGMVPHMHYAYAGDDLVRITDAHGHTTAYNLDNHRIVEETLPNGLRFHFEYDGPDTDAACTRTHGDGGILDHRLVYDRPRRTTVVTNSCKQTTIVRAGPHGEPVSVTDARGATTHHAYDEHLRLTATTDPLGRITRHSHDARGNRTRTVAPDGATTTVEYDDHDLPIAATDPAGGRWRWSYDTHGRITRRTDPLGRTTTYQHDALTTLVTHPDGRRDLHTHDLAGRLVRIDHADGRTLHHSYDRRGRLVETTHPDGARESHHHDLLNRPTRHTLANGDTRHFTYDDLGCLVRVCDARTDLRCTYTGLRWLASCGDVNAAPYTVERDLEGRILRVADATGTLLHAERDACGQLRTATDVRGRHRRTRDLAGRILEISTAGNTTTYTHDLADRITAIDHPDRSHDAYTYRPDGALLTATRTTHLHTTTVRRELDPCARLLREWQDDHWVAVTHDLHDRITHVRSSHGADLRFNYDDRGLARISRPATTWSITHERDPHGRELTRQLPGGITAWWHRDALGRPIELGITGSRPPQIHRHRRYTWTVDGRLASESDLTLRPRARPQHPAPTPPTTCPESQPTHSYEYDALGRRIADDTTHWQWCGPTPIHTILPTSPPITWIFTDATTPLARLSTTTHTILTTPSGTRTIFDEHGTPTDLLLDLPSTPSPLDIFGRPTTSPPDPALALLTAELSPDLTIPHPHTLSTDREAAVLR